MKLSTITLVDFRTYAKAVFSFPKPTTIIVGPNAIGKTNIIEAITLVSSGKSFRATRDSDMVAWGKEVAHVEAICEEVVNGQESSDDTITLRTDITVGQVNGTKTPMKRYFVNGVPRRLTDFSGKLTTVLFSPPDLSMLTLSPGVRREYLDTVLSLTDTEYRRSLLSYERGIRQRNALLASIRDGEARESQLFFWDQLIIKNGQYLTDRRSEFIGFTNSFVYDDLTYRCQYVPSLVTKERLESHRQAEVATGMTLVGPQRDDFVLFQKRDDRRVPNAQTEVARYGSRGEQRLGVLWLRLAELSYIESKTGSRPVLLLDDIFSELDHESRAIVLDVIGKQQTIITSADKDISRDLALTPSVDWIYLPDTKGKTVYNTTGDL